VKFSKKGEFDVEYGKLEVPKLSDNCLRLWYFYYEKEKEIRKGPNVLPFGILAQLREEGTRVNSTSLLAELLP
jgi:hypothetical protein